MADRHSKIGVDLIDDIRELRRKTGASGGSGVGGGGRGRKKGRSKNSKKSIGRATHRGASDESLGDNSQDGDNGRENPSTALISDVEVQLLMAIRVLTSHPGLEHSLADDIVGRPFADAMRQVHKNFPKDPEVAYVFAEALMVLNAWKLYEYPTGKSTSPDVDEVKGILEESLSVHKDHAGLCHMYVHLSEMSAHPELALEACEPLRNKFPQAGHLRHMSTHLDVLVGSYDKCVYYNLKAIEADEKSMRISPGTAGRESFYYGYIVHNVSS